MNPFLAFKNLKEILIQYRLLIIPVLIVSVIICIAFHLFWAEKLELMAYDFRMKFRMVYPDNNIIIINIDEPTLDYFANREKEGFGRFPWARPSYLKVLNILKKSSAKAIIFDFNLEGKTPYTEKQFSDKTFVESIKDIHNIFFVQKLFTQFRDIDQNIKSDTNYHQENQAQLLEQRNKRIEYLKKFQLPYELLKNQCVNIIDKINNKSSLLEEISFYQMPRMLDGLYEHNRSIGINNSQADLDGVIRSYKPVYKYFNDYLLSIPFNTYDYLNNYQGTKVLEKKMFLIDGKKIPLNNSMNYFVNWRKLKQDKGNIFRKENDLYLTIPFNYVYDKISSQEAKKIFKDKIVIIASSALKDVYETPNKKTTYGYEIIATCLDNLINDTSFLKKSNNTVNLITSIFFILLGLIILFLSRIYKQFSYKNYIMFTILIFLLYFTLNCYLFVKHSYWLNLVEPMFLYVVINGSCLTIFSIIDRDKRSQVEFAFSKYVSPQVYTLLTQNVDNVSLKSQRKEITVLFSDIRGFTTFSEENNPETIEKYLNEYFNEMVKVIFKHNGTIDKFMGDAIMAFFGAPLEDKNHALNAAKASLEMNDTLTWLNKSWTQRGLMNFNIGIGLNTGIALLGNFGSDELMDFTIIGDTVNVASRLESLNKDEGSNILISATTYEKIKNNANVRIVGPKKVKGKTDTILVYELFSLKD